MKNSHGILGSTSPWLQGYFILMAQQDHKLVHRVMHPASTFKDGYTKTTKIEKNIKLRKRSVGSSTQNKKICFAPDGQICPKDGNDNALFRCRFFFKEVTSLNRLVTKPDRFCRYIFIKQIHYLTSLRSLSRYFSFSKK